MTALVWCAYLTANIATYHRIRHHFPHWQLRAELAALAVGLALLGLLVVLVAEVYGATEWTAPDWGRGMFGPKRVPVA